MPGITSSAAEQRAREFLAQKQWRKARDELKPLVKADRARYLPLLLQANLGLSREMMSKGQVAEAQQVLANLAGMATSDELRAAERELDGGGATQAAPELADTARKLSDSAVSLEEKRALADQLVLAAPAGAVDLNAAVAAEVKTIGESLLAVSLSQWDRLTDLLRPISHRSPFAHWAAFLKGLAAFHTGNTERAMRLFEELPDGTVPAKASAAWMLWLRAPSVAAGDPPKALALEGACRLLGEPGAGTSLWKAERAWKEGRHVDSYRTLRDQIRGFPGEGIDWLGTLSDFYFNASHSLPEADLEPYAERFHDWLDSGRTKNGAEELLAARMFCIGFGDASDWERFLKLRERMRGPDRALASDVYEKMAQNVLGAREEMAEIAEEDEREAERLLRKAIELDRQNLGAHNLLALLYRSSERNELLLALLEQMVERFPKEKEVLVQAAREASKARKYTAALAYLERARELDPLDARVMGVTVLALGDLAESLYRSGQIDEARKRWAEAEPFLGGDPHHFTSSRWVSRIRQGVRERESADPAEGERLLAEARAASPATAAFALVALILGDPRTRIDASPFWQEFVSELEKGPSIKGILLLVRVLDTFSHLWPDVEGRAETELQQAAVNAVKRPFSLQEARELVEANQENTHWEPALRQVVKKALSVDPTEPFFRLFELQHRPNFWEKRDKSVKALQKLLEEATRRQDTRTVQQIRRLIESLHRPDSPLPGDDDFDVPFEDDRVKVEAEPNLPPAAEALLSGISPREAEELRPLLEGLSTASEDRIEAIRRSRPRDVPADFFEMLLALAKGRQMPGDPTGRGPHERRRR